ncbi:MAG: NHL repeat-containing protein, partial [Leptospiraceae bacterium]|nr:NHL repeat-containing protein [Leptospiraceae bacterium]
MKRVIVFGLFLVIVLCSTLSAQFTNGQSAVGVLGQTDFVTGTSGVSASQFNGPNGVAVDPLTGKLFVADRGNHRILRWASSDAFVNGSAAEAVFGQVDFTANASGLAADKLNNPIGVFVDHEGRMWVGDYTNNRVLRFDDASNAATGASADGVLGQPDFVSNSSAVTQAGMSGPVGIYTDATGALWVSNFGSHRVLRYDDAASKANGADADGVLGQLDFTTGTSGLAQDKLNNPNSVYVDANGNLYVSDFTNRRVV